MIAILGAGSLGRLWAASLPAGQAAFIARPGASQTVAGIRYRFRPLTDSETTVQVPWLRARDAPELILVTTKAGDTLEAVAGVIERFPANTPFVLFQNGLGSQQAVTARWPDRPILAASTTEGANRPEPDLLVHAGSGDTWVGPLTEPAGNHLDSIVARLGASPLRVHPETDILRRLWHKLVINAGINPYTALLDCPNGNILSAPLYQDTIEDLCGELSELMRASGQGNAPPQTLRQQIEFVARNTALNTSSMRADVHQDRRTEIDFINGYLTQLGKDLGIATPVNQMLTERVQQLSPHQQEHTDGQSPFQDIHPHRR
ncbi:MULTISPECIES: ketopantoate reductase family protein [Marinobacter]|uniref:ketopantoate reductase family protein n=1 Tax=Marinobacter TaxID=2742 RepID=UPI0020035B29|nr:MULTISPECIES: 2-dehydropantoate 2-reductase [Marinobacter]MCK7552421.1 2-dehydropantoate 2-reductase [Marinobacter goseongensis]MDV3503970.1 2-dehydropantoate 2-reductase [Marinobacter sp. M-5]